MRIQTQLQVQFYEEDDLVIANCHQLNLCSHGETLEEAKKNFTEVLNIFIEDVLNRGTLEEVLEDCGWKQIDNGTGWTPPGCSQARIDSF